jgi:hypothetical protein
MFRAKMLTASAGGWLLIAILGCGGTYAPANSVRAAKAPAPIQAGRSAAQSIADAAGLVKGQLESCGSIRTNHQHPVPSWTETSWKVTSASGCAWQFEYSDESYGYAPQDPSSGWYDVSTCAAAVNLSQLALDSITAKPAPHLPDVTEIYFTTFNKLPDIHLNCRSKTNIHVQSGKTTLSDASWKHIDQEEPDLEQSAGTGPFCTDQQAAGWIQQALSQAAALCGARP